MTAKQQLSESDIKAKFITPALLKAGWDEQIIDENGDEIIFSSP